MIAADLLTEAQADGVTLALDPPDSLKVRGDPEAVARWAPLLRPHKADLIALLSEPRRTWNVTEPTGEAWRSCYSPPQTWAEVLSRYAPGTVAAPVLDPDEGADLPEDVAELVNRWLDALGEDDPRTRAEVLQRARDVPEARADYLQRAKLGTPQGPSREAPGPSGTDPKGTHP